MNNDHYLIEYRFQGSLKYDIREMIHHLENKFHLSPSHKAVPHMTLCGGFTTKNEKQLVKDFVKICSDTPLCKYTIDGYGYFENETGVVFININPNENLIQFRWALAQKLANHCRLREFDYKQDFKFHATLAMNLKDSDFSRIKRYIDSKPEPQFKQVLIRATILKNSKILCEYDFLQRRLLNRIEALSKRELTRTFTLLDKYFKGDYNPNEASAQIKITQPESWLSKIPFIGKFLTGR